MRHGARKNVNAITLDGKTTEFDRPVSIWAALEAHRKAKLEDQLKAENPVGGVKL